MRPLEVGRLARGDTRVPDGKSTPTCNPGGGACKGFAHRYGFAVHNHAVYHFELTPTFVGVIQVKEHDPKKRGYTSIDSAVVKPGSGTILSLPLANDGYQVVVEGYETSEAGEYTLVVNVDQSPTASLRPEETSKVTPMCASAPPVRLGERSYGTFFLRFGGAHASCGQLGGNSMHHLSLQAAARVRLRAAAHFSAALEIRKGCQGAVVSCVKAAPSKHDVEVVQDLDAGEYFVVLSPTEVTARDYYGGGRRESAGGAYIIDAEEIPR